MDQVTLQVGPSVDAPSLSRTRLEELKATLGDRYGDVALVVSELVSNSVRHASADRGAEAIEVDIRVETGKVMVRVTDPGPGFSMEDPRGEGLGLAIVEKLADRFGMQHGTGTFTVWAELSLN